MSRLYAVFTCFVTTAIALSQSPTVPPYKPPIPKLLPTESGSATDPGIDELFQQNRKEREALEEALRDALREQQEQTDPVASDNAMLSFRARQLIQQIQRLRTQQPLPLPLTNPLKPTIDAEPKKAPQGEPSPKSEANPTKKPANSEPNAPAKEPNAPLVNPLSYGQLKFKAGDYEEALRGLRQVDATKMSVEERGPLDFLIGASLERIGKAEDAMGQFATLAATGDATIQRSAEFRLDMLRWQRSVQRKLEEIRQRRKLVEDSP